MLIRDMPSIPPVSVDIPAGSRSDKHAIEVNVLPVWGRLDAEKQRALAVANGEPLNQRAWTNGAIIAFLVVLFAFVVRACVG
jgi:hypothetical protein